MSSSDSNSSSAGAHPSLVGGHAQYIKGAAEGAVGNLTGSDTWKTSAQEDQQTGIDAMKAAAAQREPQQSGLGKVEQLAGKAVGCEGMEKEGAASQ